MKMSDVMEKALAALRAFMRYVAQQEPSALALASRVLAIPMKRFDRPLLLDLSSPLGKPGFRDRVTVWDREASFVSSSDVQRS